MRYKILIVEDDRIIAKLINMYLVEAGYETKIVYDGAEAIETICDFDPNIVLLDLMLPRVHGLEICREARCFYNGMIIVITASSDEKSELTLFEHGADDYITKPIKANLLLARVKALLRRISPQRSTKLLQNQLTLDESSKRIFYNDKEIKLTSSEFDIFSVLYAKFGQVVSRDECCKMVRRIEYNSFDRAVDMRVSSLRKSLSKQGVENIVIKTIRSKGYALVDN